MTSLPAPIYTIPAAHNAPDDDERFLSAEDATRNSIMYSDKTTLRLTTEIRVRGIRDNRRKGCGPSGVYHILDDPEGKSLL